MSLYCGRPWIKGKQCPLNLLDSLEPLKVESVVELKVRERRFGIWEQRTLECYCLLDYVVNLGPFVCRLIAPFPWHSDPVASPLAVTIHHT